MHTNMNDLGKAVWSAAVRGCSAAAVLAAGIGIAAAQTVQEATTPTSTVEGGAAGVSDGSYKAGEYNGLQKQGAVAIGNFDLRGGGAYDSDSAMRWRVKGIDLGLETRSLTAEVGVQGLFRINLGYDELRRNRSDSYQTPYGGAGTNVLTLPAGWQVPTVAGSTATNSAVNVLSARGLVPAIGNAPYIDLRTASPTFGGILQPTSAQIATVNVAAGADVPAFRNVDISTKRTRYDLAVDYSFNPKWGVGGDFRPEHKDGMKLMGSVSRNTGGDISTVLPDLIDQNTNQIDLRLNYRGAKGFAQASVLWLDLRQQRAVHVVAELGDGPDRHRHDQPRDRRRQHDEQRTEQPVQPGQRDGRLHYGGPHEACGERIVCT